MAVTDFDTLLEPLFRVFGKGRPLAAYLDTSGDYARALGSLHWLDDGLLAQAVEDCTRYLGALPTPKELIAVCRDVKQSRDLAAEREERKALPPPLNYGKDFDATKPPAGVAQAFWVRNIAIGKARARKRNAAAAAYLTAQGHERGFVPAGVLKVPEPTEAEIAALVEEITARGLSGTLRRDE